MLDRIVRWFGSAVVATAQWLLWAIVILLLVFVYSGS